MFTKTTGSRLLGAFILASALAAAQIVFGADPFTWRVRLLPAAAISGERVTLGEIAQPVGDMDEETWKILAETPLWHFPGREGQMTLARSKVIADLEKIFPKVEGNFIVPEQITLRKGGAKPVSGGDLRKLVVEFLTQKMANEPGDLEFKDIAMPQQVFVNEESERLSIEAGGPVAPGRVHMRLVVSDLEGKTLRQASATAFINFWRMIPVASRDLYVKEGSIKEGMFLFEKRNMAYVKGIPWDPKSPGLMRVKTSLTPGTPLTSETLEPVPLVSKGDQVILVWKGPHIQLTMPVTALTEGGKDKLITVRNMQSGKEMTAMVVDAKTVVAR